MIARSLSDITLTTLSLKQTTVFTSSPVTPPRLRDLCTQCVQDDFGKIQAPQAHNSSSKVSDGNGADLQEVDQRSTQILTDTGESQCPRHKLSVKIFLQFQCDRRSLNQSGSSKVHPPCSRACRPSMQGADGPVQVISRSLPSPFCISMRPSSEVKW